MDLFANAPDGNTLEDECMPIRRTSGGTHRNECAHVHQSPECPKTFRRRGGASYDIRRCHDGHTTQQDETSLMPHLAGPPAPQTTESTHLHWGKRGYEGGEIKSENQWDFRYLGQQSTPSRRDSTPAHADLPRELSAS